MEWTSFIQESFGHSFSTQYNTFTSVWRLFKSTSFAAFDSTKPRNNAASSDSAGKPGPINHSHGDLLRACRLARCMCACFYASGLLPRQWPLGQHNGVRVYKYIVNGIFGFTFPGGGRLQRALLSFLLSIQYDRKVRRDERHRLYEGKEDERRVFTYLIDQLIWQEAVLDMAFHTELN